MRRTAVCRVLHHKVFHRNKSSVASPNMVRTCPRLHPATTSEKYSDTASTVSVPSFSLKRSSSLWHGNHLDNRLLRQISHSLLFLSLFSSTSLLSMRGRTGRLLESWLRSPLCYLIAA